MDAELLLMLACPACPKPAPLTEDRDGDGLTCNTCDRTYPVRDGIVTLFPDGAPIAVAEK